MLELKELYSRGASSNIFSTDNLDYNTLAYFLQHCRFKTKEEFKTAYKIVKVVFDAETDRDHIFKQEFDYTDPETAFQTTYVITFNEFNQYEPFQPYHAKFGLKVFQLFHIYGINEKIDNLFLRNYTYAKTTDCTFKMYDTDPNIRKYQYEYVKVMKDLAEYILPGEYDYEGEIIGNSVTHLIKTLRKISYDWDIFFETILRNHGKRFVEYMNKDVISKNELKSYMMHLKRKGLSKFNQNEVCVGLVNAGYNDIVEDMIKYDIEEKGYSDIKLDEPVDIENYSEDVEIALNTLTRFN